MNVRIGITTLLAALTLAVLAFQMPVVAEALSENHDSKVVARYVQNVHANYQDSLNGALRFQTLVANFLANPSNETLNAARTQWIEMRKSYSPTEVYRFYSGPIDGDDGPEGLLNAWPMDEAFIDGVVGAENGGLINDVVRYPSITKELLESLNEQGGERNISVGYHALEFLLWGQDLSSVGAGERPYTDYVVGIGQNADRRREYLRLTTEILIEKLQWLVSRWDTSTADSYANEFLTAGTKEAVSRMITGIYRMAAEELSQERIFVAYDTQAQEDEHSCFSDTTHLDVYYNFLGIRNVLDGQGNDGLLVLIRAKDPVLAQQIADRLASTEAATRSIPAPFDQAIMSVQGRSTLLSTVENLEELGQLIKKAATLLGVEIQ